MKKNIKIILLVVLVLGGAVAVYGYREYNRGQKDLSKEKADLTISSTDLLNAFTNDEANANTLYLDKIVAVQGKVKSVDKDAEGNYTVQLDAGSDMSLVSCQMDTAHNSDVAGIKPGETVKMKGTCTGVLMDVVLIRCVLDK